MNARVLNHINGRLSLRPPQAESLSELMRGGKEPRIKRMKEVLGDSYFNHLANLSDLNGTTLSETCSETRG